MLTSPDNGASPAVCAFGENVKLYRVRADLSQKELAAKCKIAHPRISDIERGSGNPTLETAEKIAAALGVPLEKLVKEKKPKK